MQVSSRITINTAAINQLTELAKVALEQTAEALHTEVVQAQVMPFDDPRVEEKRVYGKRGRFAKNGREYKGKVVREKIQVGGTLQNESTFVDKSQIAAGRVSIVSSTPYTRRLYYHPEYNFDTGENPNAGGEWFEPWMKGGKHGDFCNKTFAKFMRRLMK